VTEKRRRKEELRDAKETQETPELEGFVTWQRRVAHAIAS
jgi:hypothetical protein